MLYRRLVPLSFSLVVFGSAWAADFEQLRKTSPDKLCAQLVLRFSESVPFFEGEGTPLDGKVLRAQLNVFKASLEATIESARAELAKPERERKNKDPRWFWERRPNPVDVDLRQIISENQQRWELVDGVVHLLTRIDAIELEGKGHLMFEDLSASLDDLIHLWIAHRAEELGVKVGLLVTETLRDGSTVSAEHLARAREAMNSLNEAVGQIERLEQAGRPTAENNRLYTDFLRAAGRAKLREFIAELKREGETPPSVDLLKQLLPVSFVSGLNFDTVYALWTATSQAYESVLGEKITDEMAVSMVRSAARHGLTAERVPEVIALTNSLTRTMPEHTVEGMEFAALFDLAGSPQWEEQDLVRRYQWTNAFLRNLRSEPFDFPTILALMQAQDPAKDSSKEVILAEFADVLRLEDLAEPENRLNDTALAFLVGGSRGVGGLERAHKYVTELRQSAHWGEKRPGYSPEAWVILAQLGPRYGWDSEVLAEITRRLFELRGKPMEAGRVVAVLGLVMEKKLRSASPDSPIENWELAEFMSMPYLRFTLPIEDLRLEPAESRERRLADNTFWGSEPVGREIPPPNRYSLWNWDFNDGHREGLNLARWYADPEDGSIGLRLNGLSFDSDGDTVTWRP